MIRFILLLTVFVLPQTIQAQLLSVSGYVKNHFTGQAIENAAIYESISGIGTITNKEGYYRLLLNGGKQNLKISGFGFESVATGFMLTSDTIISVDLMPLNLSSSKVAAGNRHQTDSVEPAEKPVPAKKHK